MLFRLSSFVFESFILVFCVFCEYSSFVFVQAAQVVQADAEDAKTTHIHPIYMYKYRLIDALSRHLINLSKLITLVYACFRVFLLRLLLLTFVLHLFLRFIISCDVHVVVAFFTFAMCLAFLRCSCFLFLRFRAVQAAQVVQAAKTPMPKTLRPTSGGSPRGYLHVQNVM